MSISVMFMVMACPQHGHQLLWEAALSSSHPGIRQAGAASTNPGRSSASAPETCVQEACVDRASDFDTCWLTDATLVHSSWLCNFYCGQLTWRDIRWDVSCRQIWLCGQAM